MTKATQQQYDTAIHNYRRQACQFRASAAQYREDQWQHQADRRIALQWDQKADDLENMKVLRAERDARIAKIAG